ncbi:MAG TPA: HAMP domain-containing sensor histidine kinase [Draconibacterium sp.]|nr:HAMP domain-containing sensor histidine kinase [Draconibacterium sp.]HRX12457.1 HAMP domain-containing sensor histidine kinase [Draconibacterium sp.]
MNKKFFTGIIVLMGISILGIIAVQLVWMNNAIQVKNELFSRSVNEALNNTVSKLEDLHNFGIVNHMVFDIDSLHWTNNTGEEFERVAPPPPPVNYKYSMPEPPQPVHVIRQRNSGDKNTRIEIKVDGSLHKKGAFSYKIETNSKSDDEDINIDDLQSSGNAIFIVNSDTIVSNIDSLYKISQVKIDSLLTSLDTFKILEDDFSTRVLQKGSRLKRIANQAISEFETWDVRKIDEEQLQQVLAEELVNRDIPIPFEYAILQDSTFINENPVTDSLKFSETEYRVKLYPNDIFQKNLQLALFFPGRENFVYRSLNWLLLSSFLFSLIILLTFGLSVFYILRQKKISEMKSDFINNMTHEFKTPIATISVATDSITNAKVVNDPERIRYFAGMIKKENLRMNRQVEDILTIARLDQKDFEFKWEAIDAHELINDAIQGIKIQIEKRNGEIKTDLGAKNAVVTTDKIHCTNVIYNLLDNANKYSAESPQIKISTTNKNNGILISVEDKGIGMTKAVQSKIFERFYRQTSGNIHNVKGFGLGLNYVKAVLEANHGTITVHSEPGRGSRFDVFLPFVRE